MPAAPPRPAAPPPPPPSVPPAGRLPGEPSPAGLFAREVGRGSWRWPLVVGLLPALCVLALAEIIAAGAGAALPDGSLGAANRLRVALAVLVSGLGGSLHGSQPQEIPDFGGEFSGGDTSGGDFSDGGGFSYEGIDGGDGLDGAPDGTGYGHAYTSGHGTLHSTLSVMPWTVTLLWVVVLVLGLRVMRRHLAGTPAAPAAVRVSLVGAAAALALGFGAATRIGSVHLTAEPLLAGLFTFLLTLATALLVLCRPALTAWLDARPAAAALHRAAGTTAIALLVTLTAAGLVVFAIALAHYDDLTGWGITAAALLLFNLGVSGLGLGWGAHVELHTGAGLQGGGGLSFGLGGLDHAWGGGSVAAVVAGAACCALAIGVLAARRSRDRLEQLGVAVLFTASFVVLAATGGVGSNGGGGGLSLVGPGQGSLGTSVPEALGYGLLWSFGGVVAGGYLWRLFGGRPPAPAAPRPAVPAPRPYGAPPASPYAPAREPGLPPRQTVFDLGVVQPERLAEPPDGKD
ncbi:hypothetical protein [Actinacidiphila guanduensis]|uniref:hypothetical protein n=1 Tax=Actinacidiphila guanduensis TaxID=310781 RepID=UPI0015A07F86|nr:hypothetical protein [Actinacidiphila guanduensis]